MQYEWILFDADETLFSFDAEAGLRHMFAQLGYHFGVEDFAAYQAVNKPLWVAYQDGQITAAQLQTERFTPWADKLKVTAAELNSRFLASMADICAPLPGARELVEALHGRVNLGIITNGFTELQQVRLQRTGLAHAFSTLVISEQVGVAKPDKAIFEHAFSLMGQPDKQRVLMVGDNPHSDILGGLNAGIHTCWVNARQEPVPAGIAPHYQVQNLFELKALLQPSA
ncbi:pyrimidine 5'-nucleotidase [Balneatrix alpica]|uniref:pyrimidine 5'-nucleotidase n=1 Tax=Balneatrix alpica TaxID=75684 RepID=UPI00273A2282|nr:pyrimidine 5'-nucleotidase [Balneatrix alpica]